MAWLADLETWLALLKIVGVNIVLSGDNAVVIAMAVKNLPARQRVWGIALGSGGAVVVRILCTFLVAQLLVMPYVKLLGGAVIWATLGATSQRLLGEVAGAAEAAGAVAAGFGGAP